MGFFDSLKKMIGGSSEEKKQKKDPVPESGPSSTPEPSNVDKLMFEFLKGQGLMPVVHEDGDIVFKYQMLTFVYFPSRGDTQYLHLAMPQIHEFTDDTRSVVLETINKLNIQLKVAKFIEAHGYVWILAEGIVDTTPNLEDFVPRMLHLLTAARDLFYEELS